VGMRAGLHVAARSFKGCKLFHMSWASGFLRNRNGLDPWARFMNN